LYRRTAFPSWWIESAFERSVDNFVAIKASAFNGFNKQWQDGRKRFNPKHRNHRVSTGFNIGFIRDGGKCCFDRETVYIISTSLRDALMEDREEFVEFIDSK